MSRLFGTDGVRGKANVELTPELAYRLGRAAALYFSHDDKSAPTILIGRDTRISGVMFEAALTSGITSAGGHVVLTGVIPTPGVAYLTRQMQAQAGIVISASHNPYYDNGIKFFGGDGYKLPDAVEDEIESIVRKLETDPNFERATDDRIGTLKYRHELLYNYIGYVMSTTDIRLDGMKIVLDCANGAAYEAMPTILERLGAELILIGVAPDGVNINDHCGSTHIEQLQKIVVEEGAAIGIAHDGDADRCLCVDANGNIIDGDHILIMCALEMLRENRLPNATVVTTVMANIGFRQAIERLGGRYEITKVGDRYVLENMKKNGYKLGGEQSGHIIFADYSTTGDGLITALQVLSTMVRSGKSSTELNALMTTYPQVLLNVRVRNKDVCGNEHVVEAIRAGEEELGVNGRILVRASGTEPLIRVMAEGPEREQLETICRRIVSVVEAVQ
ncbi:MAG: phosphoglucosamine mutase [Selenomonadaceae bacterium]|nr:phosphoglucosamine mutase [Selenomonadaceae bacterium]